MKILVRHSLMLLFALSISANGVCQSSLAGWAEQPKYFGLYIEKSGNIHKSDKRSIRQVVIQKKDSESCDFYFDSFLAANVRLYFKGDTLVSELPEDYIESDGILAIFGSIGDSWKLDNMYFDRMESKVKLNNIFFDGLL